MKKAESRRVPVRDKRSTNARSEANHDDGFLEDSASAVPPAQSRSPDGQAEDRAQTQIDELAQARLEAAAHLDDLQRLKAEYENYRKRVVKEQTALLTRASQQLVEKLIPVLDDLERALESKGSHQDLQKGIELVYSRLRRVLADEGLSDIEATGKPFDPNLHEAILQVQGVFEGEPVVLEELRRGYLLGERVLRPAMVKVTEAASAPTESNEFK